MNQKILGRSWVPLNTESSFGDLLKQISNCEIENPRSVWDSFVTSGTIVVEASPFLSVKRDGGSL